MEKVVSLLQEQARSLSRYGMKKYLRVMPMYAGLPYAEQMKVFERAPPTVRKVNASFGVLVPWILFPHLLFIQICHSCFQNDVCLFTACFILTAQFVYSIVTSKPIQSI